MLKLAKNRLWPILEYEPHDGQEKSTAPLLVTEWLVAGEGPGKSALGGHELTAEAVYTQGLLDKLKAEKKRREFWIVGPEYTDSEKEFRILWNDLSGLGATFDHPGSYNNPEASQMVISMYGGRFIVHAKSAKYPSTLVGEGLSGVIMAEAAKLKPSVWTKYIRPTLADVRGWSLWLSTPEGKNHFYEAYQRGLDPNAKAWASWRMPSWVNPFVFPDGKEDEEIDEMRGDMTEQRFNQEIGADFNDYVGRVFKDFDEEIHVSDLTFNPDLTLMGACDYGWTNPFVWLDIQVDVWDNVYVLREYRRTNRDINDIGDDLAAEPYASRGSMFFPDPAGPGDTAVLEKKLKVKANPSTGGELKWRLELIRQHLKLMPLHAAEEDRKPKLFIDRSCTGLIQEMNDYRYPETVSEVKSNPEIPLDKDDHGPEALGRFFRGYFGPPASPGGKGRARVRRAKVSR